MRQYLFRGKPKKESDYYFFSQIWKDSCKDGFVYGSLIVSKDRYYICVSALCHAKSCINNGITSMIEVIPETVGQFTHRNDKKGKAIFEGDIVEFSSKDYYGCRDKGKVVFRDNCYGIEYNCYKDCKRVHQIGQVDTWQDMGASGTITYSYKKIGNVFDNPELLEVAE